MRAESPNCDVPPKLRSDGGEAERHKVGLATLQCFATAFNAGDESVMRKLSAEWVEYFWESTDRHVLVSKLDSERSAGARYLETPLSVRVDSVGQVTGTIGRTSSRGGHSEVFFRLSEQKGQLRVVAINDADEQRLSDQCTEAVTAALSSVESVQKWKASLPAGINPGGFAEPLKDGHLEMSLGASLPERMETIYWATVDFGYLRLSQYGYPLPFSEEVATRVRQACVKLDGDCKEACNALGQCTRRDNTCVAISDRQCEQAEICTRFGRCTARKSDGICIATSQERCEALPSESCYGVVCRLIGSDCTAPPLPPLDEELE